MTTHDSLAQAIQRLVTDLPAELVATLAAALEESDHLGWPRRRLAVLAAVTQPAVREQVSAFLDIWQATAPTLSGQSVALALSAAAQAVAAERDQERLELVWTGPDSRLIPLRRTDQALLQLIDGAQATLHIVSFAVYRIEAIARALARAAGRGVAISLYLETPDASEGRIAYDTLAAFGAEVRQRAHIYIWPLEKRPRSADGRHGSLHAKVAIADGGVMLISSANLTEYAMTLNMELGVLIHGGPAPERVAEHLGRLVELGTFRRVEI
jgi:phosphatidylserine/phosphatidylglycerophosphate/cardiolipin synthase-like enzyme